MFDSVANTGMTVGCKVLSDGRKCHRGGVKILACFCRRTGRVRPCTGRRSIILTITNLTDIIVSADNLRSLLACALPKQWPTPYSSCNKLIY